MTTFEIRRHGENEWRVVSEITFMQDLVACFDRLAPIIDDMLQGLEVSTPRGVYRILKDEFRRRIPSIE